MTFKFKISPKLRRRLDKLTQRDKVLAFAVRKKIDQIIDCDEVSINHYKNLRGNLSKYKRTHIGSFILFFEVKEDRIVFDRLIHHDEAY